MCAFFVRTLALANISPTVQFGCVSFLICLKGMVNLAWPQLRLGNVMNDKASAMCQGSPAGCISSSSGPNQLYVPGILHWSGSLATINQNNALENFVRFFFIIIYVYIVNWLFIL